jgi:hypothetical protein
MTRQGGDVEKVASRAQFVVIVDPAQVYPITIAVSSK